MAIYREPERVDFWQLAKNANGGYVDPNGPIDCQTHTAARAIMRANEGKKPSGATGVWPPTGGAIRSYTGDHSGGTNHNQMKDVALNKYHTLYVPYYNLDFDVLIDMIAETRGAGLSGGYAPLRDSKFSGSKTFGANHEIWVNEVDKVKKVAYYVVDPLCGPLSRTQPRGLFKGPGTYPLSLLREFASELDVGGHRIANGYCYAILTKATGGAPVPAPTPPSGTGVEVEPAMNVIAGSTVKAIVAGMSAGTQEKGRVAAGTQIYKGDYKTPMTKMSRDATVPIITYPGTGWRGIMVSTAKDSPNGQLRTVIGYIHAGNITPV